MGNSTSQVINRPLLPESGNNVARINLNTEQCIYNVPRALDEIYGNSNCSYYYIPYQGEIVKKTDINFKRISDYAIKIHKNPEEALEIFNKLISNREVLIGGSNNASWSRWHNFKARHANCNHEPPQYYINYGYYYCTKFGQYLYPRFESQLGKIWMVKGRRNLQKYMDDGLILNQTQTRIEIFSQRHPNKKLPFMNAPINRLECDNEVFKKFAFNSHVPAYIDAGIEDVPIADLLRVFGQPNIEEWMDADTWKQAYYVFTTVAPAKINQPVKTAEEAWDGLKQLGVYWYEQNIIKPWRQLFD